MNPWNTEDLIDLQETENSTLLRSVCCDCAVFFKCLCFFCFKVLLGLKIQFCCQYVKVGIETQFSPDMRACNIPCLPELTFVDLRLTEKMKKVGFFVSSRSFSIPNSQKLFPDADLIFLLLSFYFASLPQSRLKWNLFTCGTCLSRKCLITERPTDFSWNSGYFETW